MARERIEINMRSGETMLDGKVIGKRKWVGEAIADFSFRKELVLNCIDAKEFEQKADLQKLSKEQLKQICYCKSVKQVHSKLSFSFENTTQLSQEEREKRDNEQKELGKKLNKYGNNVYAKCLIKNNLL